MPGPALDLMQALKASLAQPDPYPTRGAIPTGTGPGSQTYVPDRPFERPLERNVCVGPLVVSACRCPMCGDVYAHYANGERSNWYAAGLPNGEPDPPCLRCELALGIPLSPDEAAAMADFRWRYDEYVAAQRVGSGDSQQEQRAAFLAMCESAQLQAPALLAALERRYGNQQDAGVHAILNGASGVGEAKS